MTVAEMIKQTRAESNMTQEEYGLKFGVTRQTVSSWENERSLPDLQMLIDICNTYHVSLDKLLNEDKEFVEKIDFYSKYKKGIKILGMCLAACFLIFAVIFINWKITEGNMNQTFKTKVEQLGFVKEKQIYELERDDVCYQLPNQKLPFLKKDFYVKNSYADFRMGDTEISITIYDGSEFEVQLNHYRNIKGTIGKTDKIQIKENALNDTEKKFYEENKETIEQVLSRLLEIHKSVYLKS
ncbi:helix-turn-helix transcriptional regulator [Mediterraneibacter massiliensis]|uniref:helix-turn-helix transcriptional regulator n=1 Tax=Mediterraneibacter massiliensis TaxID=1720300 RepID=UPI000E47D559|nr:helix-turn-helix transcriptional regulator [Mediterraneibacter massiliensis]RGT70920.1 XRE family transcriptional regulator [Ruminococcus sp. AF18-22]